LSGFDRASFTAASGHASPLTHIAAFVGATIAVNAIIFGLGLNQGADSVTRLSWAPPGWAIGAIWVALFALYGIAHWLLRQRGASGQRAAGLVCAIAVWDLAYPFLTNGFDIRIAAWLNLITVLFTMALLWRVWRDSRAAFVWLLPSLAWVCYATALTFAAMQS
jgi:tryptophan-rich sensory protein